jgi:hypothetical protein
MSMYLPDDDGHDHDVGVEFEEFFDLPILDPEEVEQARQADDEDEKRRGG